MTAAIWVIGGLLAVQIGLIIMGRVVVARSHRRNIKLLTELKESLKRSNASRA